ncbi:hypothetical protein ACIP79_41125 [Streptomyces sp. NPDC088747]|uniref:hypothetical protein n=1 Tax=Streptomyces sp. NPDC088747 TaxID=3365886 RepID=UPI0038044FF7
MRPTFPATALRRLSLLSIGMTTTFTLTACSAAPSGDAATSGRSVTPTAHAAPKGVVTVEVANATLNAYEKSNNRANKTRDRALLATVEGGQLFEQSQADYRQLKTWPLQEQKEYGSAFSYANRTWFVPAKGTASWFAATATSTYGPKNSSLMIFDKVGGTYKLVASLWSTGANPPPAIATDQHGLAEAVDPSQHVGALAPTELPAAFADLYATGGKNSGSKLTPTKITKAAISAYTNRDKGANSAYATKKYFPAQPAHEAVYALRLADGGVLTVFPTAFTSEFMLRPPYMSNHKINPSDRESVYNSTSRVLVTNEYQGQAYATLTPTGEPRVLGYESRLVDSR